MEYNELTNNIKNLNLKDSENFKIEQVNNKEFENLYDKNEMNIGIKLADIFCSMSFILYTRILIF
jgi:hypothetical protein